MSEEAARVILADYETTVFMQLVKEYESSPDKYVEHFEWIGKCVAAGRVSYTPSVYKNPGGRRPGEECAPLFLNFHSPLNSRMTGEHSLRLPTNSTCATTSL